MSLSWCWGVRGSGTIRRSTAARAGSDPRASSLTAMRSWVFAFAPGVKGLLSTRKASNGHRIRESAPAPGGPALVHTSCRRTSALACGGEKPRQPIPYLREVYSLLYKTAS